MSKRTINDDPADNPEPERKAMKAADTQGDLEHLYDQVDTSQ